MVEKFFHYPTDLHWREWVLKRHVSYWNEECRRTTRPTNWEEYEVLV